MNYVGLWQAQTRQTSPPRFASRETTLLSTAENGGPVGRWTNAAGGAESDGGGEGVRVMEWVMVMGYTCTRWFASTIQIFPA